MKGRRLWWGVWFVASCSKPCEKYYHADYDTTVQLFTGTFMLSRAPFRSHVTPFPRFPPFLEFPSGKSV